MADPFVGEIRMFAGSFAPRSYANCDGQLLAVSQNDALFSLLGTIYGGDGRTTFGLPDLRGRVPIHAGSGPGLTERKIGQKGGTEQVTLNVANLPVHTHQPRGTNDVANQTQPASNRVPAQAGTADLYQSGAPNASIKMAPSAVSSVGGSQQHNNMMPFQTIRFIIALYGIYPSRT